MTSGWKLDLINYPTFTSTQMRDNSHGTCWQQLKTHMRYMLLPVAFNTHKECTPQHATCKGMVPCTGPGPFFGVGQ